MKNITRLSLELIMFSLFSISYLVTTVSADPRGNAGIKNKWGNHPQNAPQGSNNIWLQNKRNLPTQQRGIQAVPRHELRNNAPRGNAGMQNMGALSRGNYNNPNAPHVPRREAPDAAGSSYHLNQPVNQGGVNGIGAKAGAEVSIKEGKQVTKNRAIVGGGMSPISRGDMVYDPMIHPEHSPDNLHQGVMGHTPNRN